MAISRVGAAKNSSSPNTAVSVNVSGIGIQAGDLILVAAAVGDTADNGMAAPTEGSYNRVPGVAASLYANDTNDVNLDLYYKIAAGNETTVSFAAVGGTNASNAAIVTVFRGVDTTTPFDTNANTATGIDTSAANPPAHDWSGTAGGWTVIAAATGHTGGNTASFTFPTGYTTNAEQIAHDDTIDVLLGVGYKTNPSDPEDPAAFSAANIGTASANSWAAVTMSLKQAPQNLNMGTAIGRVASVLLSVGMLVVGFATPVKADARSPGATLTSKVALTGVSRAQARAVGDLQIQVPSFDLGNAQARSNGRLSAASLKSLLSVAPTRAATRLSPATLKSLLTVGSSKSSSRLSAANLKVKLPVDAGSVKASSRLTANLAVNLTLTGASRASSRSASGFLGSTTALTGLTRSNGLGTAVLSAHFPTTAIGTGISLASSRAQHSGLFSVVYYATPSKAQGRAFGTITLPVLLPLDASALRGGTARLLGKTPPLTKINLWSLQSPDGTIWTPALANGIVSLHPGGPLRTATPPVFQGLAGTVWTPSIDNSGTLTYVSSESAGQLWASLIDNFMVQWSFYVEGDGTLTLISGTGNHLLAAPSRDSIRVRPATIRFVGEGFDMGAESRAVANGRVRATGIKIVHHVTPLRTGHRLWAPVTLFYDIAPVRASAIARTVLTLGRQGHIAPTLARATGGRIRSLNIKLYYGAMAPSRDTARATAVLQFAGGAQIQIAGHSRTTSKAHGLQLQTISGIKRPLQGVIRAESRVRSGVLSQYHHVTPIKADPRLRGQLQSHHETGPSRGPGARAFGQLSAAQKQFLNGRVRQSTRLSAGLLRAKLSFKGASLSSSRAIGLPLRYRLALPATASRGTVRTYNSPLAFLPPNFVEIGTGISRANGRANGSARAYHAAQPSQASPYIPSALLHSTLPLSAGAIRVQGLATAPLDFQGPFVLPLNGESFATARVVGPIKTTNAGGWILSGTGRLKAATPSFALNPSGVSSSHPRLWGVLAFTGSVTLTLDGGRSVAGAIALADLKMVYHAQPIIGTGLAVGDLKTIIPLEGTVQAHALLTGELVNPFVVKAISAASASVQAASLTSALPLTGGGSYGTGRLRSTLEIVTDKPLIIFLAKHRVFVFMATDRRYVMFAKDRQFIFVAGGGRGTI